MDPTIATNAELSRRLQILATEHWSLLASRSLAWSESFNRATMFLATLSGAVVALALVAQASSFGEVFSAFALIILPVVLFIGVTTVSRMGSTNYHDAMCVMGMNRIRHAYLEIAPDLDPYFVMSPYDDPPGIAQTMGVPPFAPPYQHYLSATPALIAIINSVIAGVIGAIAAALFTSQPAIAAAAGAFGLMFSLWLHTRAAMKSIGRAAASAVSRFPGPPVASAPAGGERAD